MYPRKFESLDRRRARPALGWRGLAVVGVVGLVAAACSPSVPSRPDNVLMILSDTLRADALSCYGGPAKTPRICSLAERGGLFEKAYSNGAWTLPSSVALFTGQYPTVFAREGGARVPANRFYLVPRSELLLAEELRANGFETVAFVESGVAHKPRPFQGFDVRDVTDLERLEALHGVWGRERGIDIADGRRLQPIPMERYLLEKRDPSFFALQWFKDPHAVYEPQPRYVETLDVDTATLPQPIAYYSRLAARTDSARGWRDFEERVPGMTPAELATVRALYHKEVESVDERVGVILDALEAGGQRDRTLVIFTSDHGEGFGEHGKYFHADRWFYREFVHVPLIVAGPGAVRGVRVADRVSHIDVIPTLRELLGRPTAALDQGSSLAALLRGENDAAGDRLQYLVGTSRSDGFAALVDGRFKLITRPDSVELFDVRADPDETQDVWAEYPDAVAAMRRMIDALYEENVSRREERVGGATPERVREVGEETLRELRALGYLD